MAMSPALMYADDEMNLTDRRKLVEAGLQDALAAGDRSLEGSYYGRISRICAEEGDFEGAERYHRWELELEDSDGLTPKERLKAEIESVKYFESVAKSMGQAEVAAGFRDRLRELRKRKPLN